MVKAHLMLFVVLLCPCVDVRGRAVQQAAVYDIEPPDGRGANPVVRIELAVCSPGPLQGPDVYRLTGTKAGGQVYRLWFTAEGDPFGGDSHKVRIGRYILREGDQEPIEYIDGHTGGALLPLFGFVERLLPRRTPGDTGLLPREGTYLGFALRQVAVGPSDFSTLPAEAQRLVLRTDLLVGTSRNFRDDGTGRPSRKDNYTFVPFTRAEYDEMIDAGINTFIAKGEQVDWICRRPVFYEGYDPRIAYPEELYRSNFRGMRMFIDEPACRLAGEYPPGASLETAVKMIHEHVAGHMNDRTYQRLLTERGVALGDVSLPEPAVPIWETYIGTSYYQLEVNRYGIVQECRWRLRPEADSEMILMLQRVNEDFGVDIPITPENLFLWFYGQMRGPARALGTRWGMSIYGQCEPDLRWPSMRLAYDLGAEFIWFWTSDHDHHVEYTEQLRLARLLRDHVRSRPRRDLEALRRGADVAVVLPYGYTLPTVWQMFTWGTHIYPLDRKNAHGLTYKQVLAPAIREIARCLTDGTPYDVVPAGPEFGPTGYRSILWVQPDGSVCRWRVVSGD